MNGDRKFKWDSRGVKIFEIVIDLTLVFLGFITILMLQGDLHPLSITFEESRDLLLSNLFFLVSAIVFFRIYNTSVIEKNFVSSIFSVFFALIFSNLVSVVAVFFIKDFSYSRTSFFFTIWIQLFYIGVWKLFLSRFINRRIRKVAMIVGTKDECEHLAKKIISDKSEFVRLKYLVCNDPGFVSKEVYSLIDDVDQVYLTPGTNEKVKESVVTYCLGFPHKDAFVVPKTYHVSLVNSTPYQVSDVLTLKVESLHISLESQLIKRVFDIMVSFFALLVLSPILLFLAVLIKAHDGGPVFFRQERVTKENTKFRIFKFRSMIPDAEKDTGAVQASENDNRITSLGKIMRKTRLDELPQFINVLRGEMSIVGPRALRIEEVEEFTKNNSQFKFRAHVKAGITGLAQIVGKYDTSFEDKLRLDLMYIRNYSFAYDVILLIQTIKVVFDRESAKGVSTEYPFSELVKYYGYILENVNENILLVKRVKL